MINLPIDSGDEKGQVIVWRYEKGCVYGGCPVQDHIFSMALSYLTESELAVGWVNCRCYKFLYFYWLWIILEWHTKGHINKVGQK